MAAPEVVKLTTSDAASDENVAPNDSILASVNFGKFRSSQWLKFRQNCISVSVNHCTAVTYMYRHVSMLCILSVPAAGMLGIFGERSMQTLS